jgi:ribosomal RNA-processing protein 9
VSKKKPVCVVKNAHGVDSEENPRWICSVASLPFTDLIASGSSDGNLKLWKVSENYKDLTLIDEFQLVSVLFDHSEYE